MNTIERLAAQVALKADRVTMPGETFAALIAVAKAAEECVKAQSDPEMPDNMVARRIADLYTALATLKEQGNG